MAVNLATSQPRNPATKYHVWVLVFFIATAAQSGGKPLQSRATFAGGCFWSMESVFEKVPGVASVISGYAGGTLPHPTYENHTGHREAVEVTYDPAKVSYVQLLNVYWRNIDPTSDTGQFCDFGDSYRTAIFFHDDAQRQLAMSTKRAIERRKKFRVMTEILRAGLFYPAEEYHQDYAKKNPVRYQFYRFNCGRDRRLQQLWGSAP